MDGVVGMKEKHKYTWDGMPVHGAFDSEKEYQKALEKHKEEILALWEDMNRFSELCRTNPEAARAAAEASRAESEVAPNLPLSRTRLRPPLTDRRNAESGLLLTPCLRTQHPLFYCTICKLFTIPIPLNPARLLRIPPIH
ncbi:hypothetical protein Holit_02357 [Hollandina sp. SP2]